MNWLTETSTIADGNMSLRYGDTKTVLENRARFIAKLGLSEKIVIAMKSEHGDIVAAVTKETPLLNNDSIEADALITQEKNFALLLTTADCLPVAFFDPITETIGLMHLSRHTFVLNLIEKTVAALEQRGVDMQNLEVVIGPHIHQESYCFSLPLQEESEKLLPYICKSDTFATIDLTRAAIDTFTAHGVHKQNITVSTIDTYTSAQHFSHVRSVKQNEPEGRIATVTSLVD